MIVKPRKESLYKHLSYIAKGVRIDDDDLASTLRDKVDMVNLYADFTIPRKSTEKI